MKPLTTSKRPEPDTMLVRVADQGDDRFARSASPYLGLVDRRSAVPYYLQLKAILAGFIDRGELRPGDRVPSEAELSQKYGLSRTAIRNALNVLQQEGRIRRSRGRRTVVSRRIPWDFQLEHTTPYGDYAEPYRVRAVLENRLIKPDLETCHSLGLSDSGPVLHVLASYDGPVSGDSAAAVVRLWMTTEASPVIRRLVNGGELPDFAVGGPSLVMQLAERYEVDLAYSLTSVIPVRCTPQDGLLLGLGGDRLVFRVDSIAHDSQGDPILAIRSTPHADQARLRFVVRY